MAEDKRTVEVVLREAFGFVNGRVPELEEIPFEALFLDFPILYFSYLSK
jgi:hypothetical protein